MTRSTGRTASKFLVGLLAMAVVASACSAEEALPEPVIVEVPRLVTPQRSAGFDSATGIIRVGIIADLSGPGAAIARMQVAGAEAYWSTVNAAGGVDGRFPVELVIRDSGGSASRAIDAYGDLSESVTIFGQLVGTSTVEAVRAFLREDGLIGIPTTRQTSWVLVPNLLPVGSSYAVEALSGVSYMADRDGGERVWCVVVDGSKESEDSLFGALLASDNLPAVRDFGATSEEGAPDRVLDDVGPGDETRLVEEAVAIGCERVWIATDAETSTRVIAASARANAAYELGVGSEVGLPFPDDVAGWARDHVIVVVDAPSWGDNGLGARALRDAMAKHVPDVKPNNWVRAGFASQYAVDVVLTTSAREGDLSHDFILKLAQNLGPVDTGGLARSPDWRDDPPLPPEGVMIHVVDQVGVDPLGLRVESEYVSPIVGVIAANL